MTDGPPVITLTPQPPTQGGQLTISYTGTPGTTLDLDWDPPGTPKKAKIGPNGEVTVTVPDNADSLIVTDPTPNGALAASTSVTPA